MSAFIEAAETFDPVLAVLIYFAYIAIDSLAAYYTLSVTELRALRAASTSLTIYLLLSIGVINYTQNFLYIFPMALGGFTGTYLLVRYEKMHKVHALLGAHRKHHRK